MSSNPRHLCTCPKVLKIHIRNKLLSSFRTKLARVSRCVTFVRRNWLVTPPFSSTALRRGARGERHMCKVGHPTFPSSNGCHERGQAVDFLLRRRKYVPTWQTIHCNQSWDHHCRHRGRLASLVGAGSKRNSVKTDLDLVSNVGTNGGVSLYNDITMLGLGLSLPRQSTSSMGRPMVCNHLSAHRLSQTEKSMLLQSSHSIMVS
jgi:hypothetical protein